MKRLATLLAKVLATAVGLLALLLPADAAGAAQTDAPLRLGVLANRPKPQALAQWRPLADYLRTALAQPVQLAVYDHAGLDAAVAQRAVDVVFTSPSHFVLLRQNGGLSSPLATMIVQEKGHHLTAFGGAIIARADRADIASLADLAGKRVAAVSLEAFGGYQMQAFELLEAGMRLPSGDRLLLTQLPQDRVVEAVLAGRADAGFLRAGMIEALAHDGKLDPAQLKVINRRDLRVFPYALSTRLYPEWPVGVMPQVDRRIATRLTAALLSLPLGSLGSGEIHGFDIPANYDGVEDLLRRLHLPPFDQAPEITLADLWRRYAPWIVALAGLLALLVGASAGLLVLYGRARDTETRIKVLNAELEDRVRERTAQLETANVELLRAKDAAEAANRAKSIFLSNMSHELRTPLNAILGFAQIMERDTRLPADERKNIATINRSGNHLLALINDVLEISRIEAGRIAMINDAFDLPAALSAVEEMIRFRAEDKGLGFVVQRPADLPSYVVGDAHHLRQVLINLLGNAVKFTDRGQVSLTVVPQAGQLIRFEVGDTGPGIEPAEQEPIFHAFHQTAGGIARGEGTGLGLAISREFVRLMGGQLTVTSTPGLGSTFAFTIPLPPTDTAPKPAADRVIGLAPGQAAPRILVAEDHPDSQQVVRQLIEQIGCEVRIAANGSEAVALFQGWMPQLILMDMRMPVMDGYQATRAIRALPRGDTIPIVALTASAFAEDQGEVLAAGCNEVLRKPVQDTTLFETIGRLLGLRFAYAPTAPAAIAAQAVPADLCALPGGLQMELRKAAAVLDKEATLAIVERLRADHPAEAQLIAELVEGYRFDKVQELCK